MGLHHSFCDAEADAVAAGGGAAGGVGAVEPVEELRHAGRDL